MNIPEIESNFRELDDILCAGYAPNVISTPMELGLFDALFEEPIDSHTLAAKLGTVEDLTEAFASVLVSHVIYAWKGHLGDVFERINKAMVPGDVFVSNHMAMDNYCCGPVSGTMMELMTRLGG